MLDRHSTGQYSSLLQASCTSLPTDNSSSPLAVPVPGTAHGGVDRQHLSVDNASCFSTPAPYGNATIHIHSGAPFHNGASGSAEAMNVLHKGSVKLDILMTPSVYDFMMPNSTCKTVDC